MALKLITRPTAEPVSLETAKAHCKVTHTDEDALIAALIVSARREVENRTRRQIMTATYDLTLDAWPLEIALPRPPLQSVESITYMDTDGETRTLGAERYVVMNDSDSVPAQIVPADGEVWPATKARPGAVVIRFMAGWTTADDVPEELKQWILLRVSGLFEHREDVAKQGEVEPVGRYVDSLLDAYTIPEVV